MSVVASAVQAIGLIFSVVGIYKIYDLAMGGSFYYHYTVYFLSLALFLYGLAGRAIFGDKFDEKNELKQKNSWDGMAEILKKHKMSRINIPGSVVLACLVALGLKSILYCYALYAGEPFAIKHASAILYVIGMVGMLTLTALGRFTFKPFLFLPDDPTRSDSDK